MTDRFATMLTGAVAFVLIWGAPLAWLVFQTIALTALRGRGRILSAVPLLGMVPVGYITYASYRQHSNLWPIMFILASFPALGWVLACIARDEAKKRKLLSRGVIAASGLALALLALALVTSNSEEANWTAATIQRLRGTTIQTQDTRLSLGPMDLEGKDPDKLLAAQHAFEVGANGYVACYERSFADQPRPGIHLLSYVTVEPDGKVRAAHITRPVLVAIEPDGRIRDSPVPQSNVNLPAFEQCIVQAMQRLDFGPQKDQGPSVFRLPMLLGPSSQPQ